LPRVPKLPLGEIWPSLTSLPLNQPFLMVLLVTPVSFCHRYLSHPAIPHIIANSFLRQFSQLNLRPGLGQWPAALTVLAAFTGRADLLAPILDCRAGLALLLKVHLMLISLKQEPQTIITVHLMKNMNS